MARENRKVSRLDAEEDFSLEKALASLLEHWKVFTLSIVTCLVLAFLYLRYATPQYKIHGKILIEDQQSGANSIFSSSSSLTSTFSDLFNVQSSVDNEAEILKTRDLMEKVVRTLDLNITYLNQGRVNTAELYKRSPYKVILLGTVDSLAGIYSISFPSSTKYSVYNKILKLRVTKQFGDTVLLPVGALLILKSGTPFENYNYAFAVNSIDGTVADYMKAFDVEITGKKVSTIDLELISSIRGKGEDIVSTLIREYLNGNVQEKNKVADSTIAFINQRLTIVNSELSLIENDVESFKQTNKIANIEAQSNLIVTNSSDYYNQLTQVEVQLSVVKTMLEYLHDEKNNARPVPSLTGVPDPNFTALILSYNNLLAQRDRLKMNSTDNNPYVENINEQIKNVRQDLFNNLQNQEQNYKIVKANLVNQNGMVANTIKKVPAQERKFLDLSRQQDIKQALFLYLLQKKEEVEVSKASNIAGARIIDHPKAEIRSYFPNKMVTMCAGLFLGALLPFGFLYLKDLLNNKISTRKEIEEATQVPILAEITHNPDGETIVMKPESRSSLSEQFRALRTSLQFFVNSDKENVILFTSSMAGEGKSFTALNLSLALAISGKTVMLMELDLRKPNLSPHLNIPRNTGFTNFIINPIVRASEITIQSHLNENLFFIASGPLPPNPTEIILSNRTDTLMTELRAKYDYVIIDAPPIGLVTDAQLLSKYSDMTIYLVRLNYTFKKQLNIVDDLQRNHKMKNVTVLANDVKVSRNSDFAYGYGYGYGYEEEIKKAKKRGFMKYFQKQ